MDSNNKIYLKRGLATDANGKPITAIDADSCNCGIDTCDCALIMTDLETGNKFALYFLDGALAFSAIADFNTFKESGDVADLNETVVATV